jgi:serine/threonine-protein kinase
VTSVDPTLETTPAATEDPLIGTYVGEFRVERKLADGGMSTVYAAIHPLIGKRAAIKVMSQSLSVDASAVLRFVQEARAVNQIGHPNIVDVFSFGRLPDGRNYFVMEWLQGESLYERMYTRRLSVDECLEILDQVCDALQAAHDKGIIHRDIKPANIFVGPVRGRPDRVRLLDFGVAKLQAADQRSSSHTRTGFVVGTPDYLSPEQARSKAVDHRTDIYALGAVLFEMIVGRLPFLADNAMDIVRQHMTDAPPRPSSLWPPTPPRVEALILRMLEKDPANRPSLAEVRQEIFEIRSEPVRTPTPPPRRRRGFDARRFQMATGTITLALGLALLLRSALHAAKVPVGSAAEPAAVAQANAVPAASDVAWSRPMAAATPAPRAQLQAQAKARKKTRTIVRVGNDYLIDPFNRGAR